MEELCLAFLQDKGLEDINKAVIGVAAPILGIRFHSLILILNSV